MSNANALEQRERCYQGIKDVIDLPTRRILYIQFVQKYYPECYDVLVNGK